MKFERNIRKHKILEVTKHSKKTLIRPTLLYVAELREKLKEQGKSGNIVYVKLWKIAEKTGKPREGPPMKYPMPRGKNK